MNSVPLWKLIVIDPSSNVNFRLVSFRFPMVNRQALAEYMAGRHFARFRLDPS
jgi:hypothetical protein